jgi:hypothetical protein
MAWFEPLVAHARNPRWDGPLCRYQVGEVARSNCRAPIIADVEADVTCVHCLRRLGKLPKQVMPGQRWIMKKKREMFGGGA